MTQCEKIMTLLSDGKWHRGEELNRICFRYSARIHELKKEGYRIEKRYPTQRKGNPAWEYRLVTEDE